MRDDAWKWSMYRETCKSFIFCKILCVCKFTHDIIFKLLWIQITVNEADVLKSTKITIHKIWMIYIKTPLWNLSTFSTVMGTSLCRKSLWYKKKKNVVFLLKKKKSLKMNLFIMSSFFLHFHPWKYFLPFSTFSKTFLMIFCFHQYKKLLYFDPQHSYSPSISRLLYNVSARGDNSETSEPPSSRVWPCYGWRGPRGYCGGSSEVWSGTRRDAGPSWSSVRPQGQLQQPQPLGLEMDNQHRSFLLGNRRRHRAAEHYLS